jgi:hypothetical protein
MGQKRISAWSVLQRKSASLRRGFEQLVEEFAQLARSDSGDAISGPVVARAEIEEWKTVLSSAAQIAESANAEIQRKAAEALESFEGHLGRALRDAGLHVYGETALLVINGIVHAEIETKKGSVRINGKVTTDMSVGSVKQVISEELDRLRKLVTPPEKFIRLLLSAYEAERNQTAKEFGSQVQTSGILWQLALLKQQPSFRSNPTATAFREYPRELFRADLFRLLESNLTNTDGKLFRYASGSDTAGAVFMFVPQLGRTAHIGRIWFEPGDGN